MNQLAHVLDHRSGLAAGGEVTAWLTTVAARKAVHGIRVDDDGAAVVCGDDDAPLDRFAQVCVGGTFDGCHAAHKMLLTEAALLGTDRLLVGIASDELLRHKKLRELIGSVEDRRQEVREFFRRIVGDDDEDDYAVESSDSDHHAAGSSSSCWKVDIVSIGDPAGPAAWDGTLECIALSQETMSGGEYCNNLRRQKGLRELAVHVINNGELLHDQIANPTMGEEEKVSSSSLRLRKLGTLLKNPENPFVRSTVNPDNNQMSGTALLPDRYVLGLTGGSGCGKSSIAQYLKEEGCFVVDCDKIGQHAYSVPHSDCWEDLVGHFGTDNILTDDGSERIDRRKLGGIVFADKHELERLNAIVWPHIQQAYQEEIRRHVEQETKKKKRSNSSLPCIIVLDAAVLLQANWHCDEIWVTFVSREEQIKRIVARDGKTEEQAAARIDSQPKHEEVIKQAHVLLTTMYEPNVTKEIVKKAHTNLLARLQAGIKMIGNE